MKKIFTIFFTAFIICLIPFSIAEGQEKRNEQKIKIMIDDGTGEKIVVDTLIKDGMMKDSIVLKDGKVILIRDTYDETINGTKEGPHNVMVTVTSDGNGTKEVVKEITVVSPDSVNHSKSHEYSKIYVYSDSKQHKRKSGEKYKVVTSKSSAGRNKGESIIYINEENDPEKEIEKTADVYVSSDDKEADVEMTRYVIAKDGMVVTVEGKDEAKAKELVTEIRNKMGIKNDRTDKKETVKAETGKSPKK
jgi:hypothetical protein